MTDGESGQRRFFIENSPFSSKKPAIVIHDGDNIDGPIIGLSRFHRFSANCDVKLDTHEPWMSLTKGLVSTSFSFQAALPSETRILEWKRTRSMGVHSSPYGNTKLVDERSHDVLAVFSSNPTSLVTGRLDMYVDYGESFDRMALLTGLVVREKQRRQTTRTVRAGLEDVLTVGAAGGGAGGGGC